MLKDNFRLGSFHLLFDHGSWRWRFGRSPSPTNSVFVRVVLMRSALFASHTRQSCGDWVTIRHHWPVNPACGEPTWTDSSATEKSTRPTQAWAGWPRSIRRKGFNPWSSIRWTTPKYLAAKQFNSLQRPRMDCIAVICHGHLVTVAFAEGHIIKGSDFTCEPSLYALDYLTPAGLDLTDPISCLHSIGQLFEGM